MYYKIILNTFFILFVFVVQISFISALPWYFSMLNLGVISLVLILIYADFEIAIVWSISLGLLFDFYFFEPFGLYIFSFLCASLLIRFVFVGFITNQSLYSFLTLVVLALFLFQFFSQIFAYFLFFFNHEYLVVFFKSFFWEKILKQIFINFVFAFLIFQFFSFISDKFKPFFLIKKR